MARCWYILHTYSGFEEKVKTTLIERVKKAGQEELFGEILVPTEQVGQSGAGAAVRTLVLTRVFHEQLR